MSATALDQDQIIADIVTSPTSAAASIGILMAAVTTRLEESSAIVSQDDLAKLEQYVQFAKDSFSSAIAAISRGDSQLAEASLKDAFAEIEAFDSVINSYE